jgi:hypothetical protein
MAMSASPGETAMGDRLSEVEARLAAVERRLSALESARGQPGYDAEETPDEAASAALAEDSISNAATHLGRILLIFGGAYLLRAITDYGFLPTLAGLPLGAVYALLWLYMAYRCGATATLRVSAVLYGGVSVLLGLPMLVEAVTRFEVLSGPQSAVALILFCALTLTVAVLRNLRSLGWLITAGGMLTAGFLLQVSRVAIPFTVTLLILGLVSLWIVYLRHWRGLQWLGAAGANLGIVLLAVLSRHEQWAVGVGDAYFLAAALWCAYLLSFAVRSHVQGQPPGVFETAQAVFASAVSFGVAFFAAQVSARYMAILAALALLFGVGAYALAFTPETRAARGRSFFFYSSLGLALVVGGSALLIPTATAAVAWALLAVVMAWLSGRQERVAMSLQCTILLVAAGLGSGAFGTGLFALISDPVETWPGLAYPPLVVAGAAVACLFIPVAQRSDRWGTMASLPQLIVLLLAVWIVGGLVVMLLAPVLAAVPGPSADLGTLATLRTAVLAVAAVTLALSSRHRRWPEARWLAYPVLATVGVKLLLEDFPNGRPLTLFMALALVGGALILVSKLLPRRNTRTAEA